MAKRWLLLIAVIALASWVGKFVVYNFVGTALAAYGRDEMSREAAVAYAPAKAEVYAALARYRLFRAEPGRAAAAVEDLRKAVAASPRDYRYWLALGRAYESGGEPERAEASLQRATELAPGYFEPRWALANSRLRAGRVEPALADFRLALALSGGSAPKPDYATVINAYAAVAEATGGGPEALERAAPTDAVSRAYLAGHLAERGARDAALDLWRRLPADDPESYRSLAFQLLHVTQTEGRFEDEREVWRRLLDLEGIAADAAEGGGNLITNPGFERAPLGDRYPLLDSPPTGFDWVVQPHPEVRARRDGSITRGGAAALRLTFAVPMRTIFQEVSQLVAVEPSRRYRLSFWAKTARLPEAAPFVELRDARRPDALSLRAPVPSGTTGWGEVILYFTTPPETRALRLVVRSPQLMEVNSTNVGEVWLDDFRLEQALDQRAEAKGDVPGGATWP